MDEGQTQKGKGMPFISIVFPSIFPIVLFTFVSNPSLLFIVSDLVDYKMRLLKIPEKVIIYFFSAERSVF